MGRNTKNKNNFLYIVEYSFTGIRVRFYKRSYSTPLLFDAGECTFKHNEVTLFESPRYYFPNWLTRMGSPYMS